MTWFKLSVQNVKKCVQDYVVYFLTLVLGVALFYVFNAIGDQTIIKELVQSNNNIIQLMLLLLDGISVVVALVLGILILYANSFWIRRRKKEFGIYLLLGMGKWDVSKILLGESLLVGIVSLIAGLGMGIFLSQFVSIIMGKFFDADMSAYVFSVSMGAIGKTIVNFLLMYLIVVIFHAIMISKYKLIQLLSDGKHMEKQVLTHPAVASVVFGISVAMLGTAYYRMGFCSENVGQIEMVVHILLGIVGTFLLFQSFSGFVFHTLRRIKGIYYRNLNAFVIRQFCNSIHSSACSMAIICLMLFVTICTFSSGFTITHLLQENIRGMAPVDFSIVYAGGKSVTQLLGEEGMDVNEWAEPDYVEIPIYTSPSVTYATSLEAVMEEAKAQFQYARWNTPEEILSISDYNALASIYGNETYELKADEYLIVCNYPLFADLRNAALEAGEELEVGSITLKPAFTQCVDGYIYMSGTNVNTGILVVSDEAIATSQSGLEVTKYVLAGNYSADNKEEKRDTEQQLINILVAYGGYQEISEGIETPVVIMGTKIEIQDTNSSLAWMVAFVIIYIGIVFLISSAALLALKALSESIDSCPGYTILKNIGSDSISLRRALFVQIGTYFALPLLVAVIHSIFGLRFIGYTLHTFTQMGYFSGVCVTSIILLILYGGYMLATIQRSRQIVGIEE